MTTIPPLITYHDREHRLRRMTADARAIYDRIVKLREDIGKIDCNVAEILRELRGDE